MIKRAFDATVAAAGLILLAPVLLLLSLLILLDSGTPVFFRQTRVGRGMRPFRIIKFRTMAAGAGPQLTASRDPRLTRIGRILRRFKLDELPQLWNVLLGEMSLVGPRPEVPKYVDMFRERYESILAVRPGITDPASLRYHDEERLLGESADPERLYVSEILPAKLALCERYLQDAGLGSDLKLIASSVLLLLGLKPGPPRRLDIPAKPPYKKKA